MFSKADIEKYFLAEKQAGLVFLLIGIAALVVTVILFFVLKRNFYKGMAVPFFLIGIIVIITGAILFGRSDKDRVRNVYAYDMNPLQLQSAELPRMEKVMKSFRTIQYAEIILIAAGFALFIIFFKNPEKSFWKGVGISLVLCACIMFFADVMAAKRGQIYYEGLKSFVEKK